MQHNTNVVPGTGTEISTPASQTLFFLSVHQSAVASGSTAQPSAVPRFRAVRGRARGGGGGGWGSRCAENSSEGPIAGGGHSGVRLHGARRREQELREATHSLPVRNRGCLCLFRGIILRASADACMQGWLGSAGYCYLGFPASRHRITRYSVLFAVFIVSTGGSTLGMVSNTSRRDLPRSGDATIQDREKCPADAHCCHAPTLPRRTAIDYCMPHAPFAAIVPHCLRSQPLPCSNPPTPHVRFMPHCHPTRPSCPDPETSKTLTTASSTRMPRSAPAKKPRMGIGSFSTGRDTLSVRGNGSSACRMSLVQLFVFSRVVSEMERDSTKTVPSPDPPRFAVLRLQLFSAVERC